jgi:GlpG protein
MIDCKALEVALDEDLRELSRYLWAQGLPHRITEQSGRQTVWVEKPEQVDALRELYARWHRGEGLPPVERAQRYRLVARNRFDPGRVPLTCLLIVLSIAGYLIAEFDHDLNLLPWLTFFPFQIDPSQGNGSQIQFSLPVREYWRLITPIFLHFSPLHIVFNMLWLWDLGGRVERVQGRWRLLGIVLLIGMGSNIAQATFEQAAVFGGMSGVIYGLLGYSWAWGALRRDPALHVPTPIVVMMVAWLLICIVGFTELLGLGSIANAAHVGGLILGLLLGVGAAMLAGRRE